MDEAEIKELRQRIAQCKRLVGSILDADVRRRIEDYEAELSQKLDRLLIPNELREGSPASYWTASAS